MTADQWVAIIGILLFAGLIFGGAWFVIWFYKGLFKAAVPDKETVKKFLYSETGLKIRDNIRHNIDHSINKQRWPAEMEKAIHEAEVNIAKGASNTFEGKGRVDIATAEIAEAQAGKLRAEKKITEQQGFLLEKIMMEMKIDNISPEQCFILIKMINPNADASVSFIKQKELVEEELEKMRQENRKIKADADVAEAVSKKSKEDIDRIRDKSKAK